jgi:hypothetical protein
MNRLTASLIFLLVFLIVLPSIAQAAQAAVPALFSLLLFIGVARFLMPPGKRK